MLKNSNSGGNSDEAFGYGWVGNGALVPLVGDWNGSGKDSLGSYQKGTGTFLLKNSNVGAIRRCLRVWLGRQWRFSSPGRRLDGFRGKIGSVCIRKGPGTFLLKNSNVGAIRRCVPVWLGQQWRFSSPGRGLDGSGKDTIGLYQKRTRDVFAEES